MLIDRGVLFWLRVNAYNMLNTCKSYRIVLIRRIPIKV